MKNVILFIGVMLLVFGGNVLAYEGGSKVVATMTHPETGEAHYGPIVVVSHDELTPAKPVMGLLRRIPQPTLSLERIREEKAGPSSGTKAVVLFQK